MCCVRLQISFYELKCVEKSAERWKLKPSLIVMFEVITVFTIINRYCTSISPSRKERDMSPAQCLKCARASKHTGAFTSSVPDTDL